MYCPESIIGLKKFYLLEYYFAPDGFFPEYLAVDKKKDINYF